MLIELANFSEMAKADAEARLSVAHKIVNESIHLLLNREPCL